MAMYNRGGQQRTIQAGCGWCRKGHPTEVNRLYLIHKKYCKEGCATTDYEAPEFNKEAGNMNGWNGSSNKGGKPTHIQSTCLVDGKRIEVVSEGSSISSAMRDLRLDENRDSIISIAEAMPTSTLKSGAKRNKKKKKNPDIV